MKASEIRDLTPAERFQHAINQLDNPLRLNIVRKDIARIKTIIKEKEKLAQ